MDAGIQSILGLKRKMWFRKIYFISLLLALLLTGCSVPTVKDKNAANPDRFALAEQEGQFITVNRSVDCQGTRVTIEKILLDKTHTFMLAAVEGEIKGDMDTLTVDLFGDYDQDLGRSNFSQKLADGKTLLAFDALAEVPASLRLEFFGGPVGYSGNVNLTLNDIPYKLVDEKYTGHYLFPANVAQKGYQLKINTIEKGISETGLQYQLSAAGDFDGIEHGWLAASCQQSYPQILHLSADGCNLEPHLPYPYQSALSYRSTRDGKAGAGRAYFDRLPGGAFQVKLTDIYGYYLVNEIIPLDGVTGTGAINRKLPARNYCVELKSFKPGQDKRTWILTYRVLDSAGQPVAGAIDAGIYRKEDNYNLPCPILINASANPVGQDQTLVFSGELTASGEGLPEGAALKLTRLGIRQEDTVVTINLINPSKPDQIIAEGQIMAAVRAYYTTYGQALKRNDRAVMEQNYSCLQPTGREGDGVNEWRQEFQVWSPLGVQDYMVAFEDPIIMIGGDTATADIAGQETIVRSDGNSGSVFNTIFSLVHQDGIWKISKVDRLTDAEIDGVVVQDVLETYQNKRYGFSFDIPLEWEGKYKAVETNNENYDKLSFVYTEQPGFEPEIFAIIVMSEEEFAKVNAERPGIPEQDILGRKNHLVYYHVSPIVVPYTKEEDMKTYGEVWSKLLRSANDIPKRFHLE